MPADLNKLNAKIFSEHLHSRFTASTNGMAPMALELFEVTEHDSSPQMELFTLHFLGAAAPRLPQHIHRLEHEKLGALEIFLTPISADPQAGAVYEVIFYRFRQP